MTIEQFFFHHDMTENALYKTFANYEIMIFKAYISVIH